MQLLKKHERRPLGASRLTTSTSLLAEPHKSPPNGLQALDIRA